VASKITQEKQSCTDREVTMEEAFPSFDTCYTKFRKYVLQLCILILTCRANEDSGKQNQKQ